LKTFKTSSKKNYDDLRYTNVYVPRILVVVVLADDINSWLYQCEEELVVSNPALKGLSLQEKSNKLY
jgi:hypothetical protein